MSEQARQTEALRQVNAKRISTEDADRPPVEEQCEVAVEGPLTLDVADVGAYTVLCTPTDKRAMTVGFLFSEGLIDDVRDIGVLNECADDPNVMRVKLVAMPTAEKLGRNLLITSSCGLCGSESMDEKLAQMPKVGNTMRVAGAVLRQTNLAVKQKQAFFKRSGGTHAAQIFAEDGTLISFAEDIGRHNALDKAIGQALLQGRSTAGCGAALSGRVSLEMVGKSARAGIELISAVSAPTTLALDAAHHTRITLCAFVRDDRATVFTLPERVITAP